MTDTFLALITILINILVFYTFIKTVLKRKAEKPLDYILLVVLYILTTLATFLLNHYGPVKMLVNAVLELVISIPVFKVSFKKILLANLAYQGVLYSVELSALMAFEKIYNINGISGVTMKAAFVPEIICQLIILIVVLVLNTVFKKGVFTNLDIKGWFVFAFFPLFSTIATIDLVFSSDAQNVKDVYNSLVIFATGMLILNILIFSLIDNVVRRENEIREKELLLEQSEHLNQMYRSLSDEREKQKARSHDYMNHLNIMLMLAREGKVDEEIRYIEEQLGREVQSVDIIDTGNTLINAVLNIKYLEAKEKGIIIPFIADNLTGLKISDSDLVTILTNILDNAIEAVQKCEEKRIVFKIIKDSDLLIIDSTNPYTGQLPDEDSFVTTKNDKKNHGFGLLNVKNTVKANKGNCFIDTEGGIFHISIAIPLA